ncbi:MAG: CoA transferase [Ruminococcaceae bacterium]|nr:CoA transferase [Oscillospiraceae bacterium]
MNQGPLSGIKVVEMAVYVAAPCAARLLADMGAEVIKVEAPTGDSWRPAGVGYSPRFNEDENPVFDIYNTGKKHISLNAKTPEGKEAIFKLLEDADVFITNLRPAVMKRLGLSYEDLKERFPSLIYGAVLGFGKKGPDAAAPAYDTTAFWARSGFFRDMGIVDENGTYNPVGSPSSVGDTATGYLLMGEICAALYRRTLTGQGDYVTSTLYHNGVFCMGTMIAISQEPFGRKYPRMRSDGGFTGGYECSDGEWIYFPGGVAKNLPRFFEMIEQPELLEDPRFNTGAGRWENRKELIGYFAEALKKKPAKYWAEYGRENDLPVVYMAHFRDVPKDPQAWENGYLEHVKFRNGNVDVMPASPIEMESFTPPPTKPAPAVGADTVEILSSLGYTDEEIKEMIASGAAIVSK